MGCPLRSGLKDERLHLGHLCKRFTQEYLDFELLTVFWSARVHSPFFSAKMKMCFEVLWGFLPVFLYYFYPGVESGLQCIWMAGWNANSGNEVMPASGWIFPSMQVLKIQISVYELCNPFKSNISGKAHFKRKIKGFPFILQTECMFLIFGIFLGGMLCGLILFCFTSLNVTGIWRFTRKYIHPCF